MDLQKLWILKSKGTESAFGGNTGYDDVPTSYYIYDTTVKNHNRIKPNDAIVIVDKKNVIGASLIEDVETKKGVRKTRYRCPICNTQEHYERKSMTPKRKCRNKHEFDDPVEEHIFVDEFKAIYSKAFTAPITETSVKILENYYINRNLYYSIQQANPNFLSDHFPTLAEIQRFNVSVDTKPNKVLNLPPYIPSILDSRQYKNAKIPMRPEQSNFRKDLVDAYGAQCMLSGCDVLVAIEASHICPFRGKADNHIENGLLLRKDIHALFDADLLGVDPESLRVRVSKILLKTYYAKYHGKRLNFLLEKVRPSKDALTIRWNAFCENNQTEISKI